MPHPDLSRIPLPTAGQAQKKTRAEKVDRAFGGPMPGSGRKKGSINLASAERLGRLDRAAAEILRQMTPEEINALSPKEMMLIGMRALFRIGDIDRALKVAADVAPYVDPKLQATALMTEDGLRALATKDIDRLIALARGDIDGVVVDVGEGEGAAGEGELD